MASSTCYIVSLILPFNFIYLFKLSMSKFTRSKFTFSSSRLSASIAIILFAFSTSSAMAIEAINGTSVRAVDLGTPESTDDLPITTLDPIVVTANRTPTRVQDTLVQTRIIDSEILKSYRGQTALEVLSNESGFAIKQDGGIGQSSNFYVRGLDSKRVLVLIDGIRYGSMSSGQPALSLLPAEHIDRIEVLYGSMGSSMYGSDAIGGVIQIFSKGYDALSDAGRPNVSATVGVGSHNHYVYEITGQWLGETTNGQTPIVSVSASHNETDGISSLARQTGNNTDDDGFDSDNVSIYAKVPLNQQFSIGTSGLYADSRTEFDNYTNAKDAYIDQKNGAVSLFADYRLLANQGGLNLTVGQSLDELDNNVGDAFTTEQSQVTLKGDYALPVAGIAGKLIGGLEWLEQSVDVDQSPQNQANATYAYTQDDRTVNSAFLGYQLTGERIDAQINGRFDDNSQYGSETTYGIGIAGHLNNAWRVGTNYSTGFRAPTLSDLYVQSPYYIPSPDLEVENSKSTEVFIEHATDNARTRLTGYRTDVDNLISNEYDVNSGKYQARNIDDVQIEGIGFTSDWLVDDYRFGLAYDYTDAVDKRTDNQLVYRPKNTGLIYAGYDNLWQQGVNVRAEVKHVGERYNAADNSTELPDYQLFNVSATAELTPHLSLTTRINNLLNEDYSTNETFGEYGTRYNTDGTNYMLSLTYQGF